MGNHRRVKTAAQSGSIIVTAAISLFLILGLLGLVLDLGQIYLIKIELQRAADAGALAGARALFFPQVSAPPQCSQAQAQAWEIAQANYVSGSPPIVGVPSSYSVPYGSYNWTIKTFVPGCSSSSGTFTNAVAVKVRKENIPLYFMGIFGFGPLSLGAESLAAMGWVGSLSPGVSFVLALGKKYIKTAPEETYIRFYPDVADTGGWFSKAPNYPSNSLMRSYLENPQTIPALSLGDTVYMDNGVFADVLHIIKEQYEGKIVWLPVVNEVKFNQSAPIAGFTPFLITLVELTGHKYIKGLALQLTEVPGSVSDPGGDDCGLLIAPRLVQ